MFGSSERTKEAKLAGSTPEVEENLVAHLVFRLLVAADGSELRPGADVEVGELEGT